MYGCIGVHKKDDCPWSFPSWPGMLINVIGISQAKARLDTGS